MGIPTDDIRPRIKNVQQSKKDRKMQHKCSKTRQREMERCGLGIFTEIMNISQH